MEEKKGEKEKQLYNHIPFTLSHNILFLTKCHVLVSRHVGGSIRGDLRAEVAGQRCSGRRLLGKFPL